MTRDVLHLRALGCEVTMRFRYAACWAQAAGLFDPLLTEPWRSPDVIIECDWPRMRRVFIRSRTTGERELDGVRIFSEEHPNGAPWASLDPPFPPVQLAPFRDRFVRLHAAGVVSPQGTGLAVLGESGHGKSTVSFHLVREHGYTLLSDEDLFLHRRSFLAEPFAVGAAALWRELRHAGASGHAAWTGVVAQHPVAIQQVIVLNPEHPEGTSPARISPEDCFRALLAARRRSGSGDTEDIATVALIARSLPAAQMRGADYHALLVGVKELVSFVGAA